MNTYTINLGAEYGTDLSSRHRASELRAAIEYRVASGDVDRIVIDLRSVRTISHSFADELFAVLVLECGESWFRDHIGITQSSPSVRQTVLEAIQQRLEHIST